MITMFMLKLLMYLNAGVTAAGVTPAVASTHTTFNKCK